MQNFSTTCDGSWKTSYPTFNDSWKKNTPFQSSENIRSEFSNMNVTPIDRAISATIQENTPTLETDIAISSATIRDKEVRIKNV